MYNSAMLNTLRLFDDLKETMNDTAARKIAQVMGDMYEELRNSVTKTEFNELKEIVRDLAEAQRRTEARVEELSVEMRQLAEAQKRTEEEVRKLAKGLDETRTMVGGLSDTVGYGLEDKAIRGLPPVLDSEYGIKVSGGLVRKYVEYPDGRNDELNIFGEGVRGGAKISICGEAKARLSKKHIDSFLKLTSRLDRHGMMRGERFLFMVAYTAVPETLSYAEKHGVAVIPSWMV